jgi:hypothetical protein
MIMVSFGSDSCRTGDVSVGVHLGLESFDEAM